MKTAPAPTFAAGEECIRRKQRWKITQVYGHPATYRCNMYAAVRWIKSTQKWSGNAYLIAEDEMVRA